MTDTKNSDLDTALKLMRKAKPGYDKAEKYYEGKEPEVFASPRVQRVLRQSGMNFNLNFAATPVDAVCERLALRSISSEDAGAQAAWQDTADENLFPLQVANWFRKVSIFGDAYVLAWPDPEDDSKVTMTYQDPRIVRAIYDAENTTRINYYIKSWQTVDGLTRADLYYLDRIERFVSRSKSRNANASDFAPYSDDEGDTLVNPCGRFPFFHLRTDADEYGEPEHKRFFTVQDMIHKLVTNFAVQVDYQSFPQRVALLMDGTDTSEPADLSEAAFDFPDEFGGGTNTPDGEGTAALRADPGSVWWLNNIKDIKQFDPADPTKLTDPIKDFVAWGANLTSTPLSRFSPTGQQPSGESLKMFDAPFVKKIENRQLSYGATLKGLVEFSLLLKGFTESTVEINWDPATSSDNASDWAVAAQKQASGVPVAQTLLENGYTNEQVTEWLSEGDGDLPQRLDNLVRVGEFLASAATAVAAGAISQSQVDSIMTRIMGDDESNGQ